VGDGRGTGLWVEGGGRCLTAVVPSWYVAMISGPLCVPDRRAWGRKRDGGAEPGGGGAKPGLGGCAGPGARFRGDFCARTAVGAVSATPLGPRLAPRSPGPFRRPCPVSAVQAVRGRSPSGGHTPCAAFIARSVAGRRQSSSARHRPPTAPCQPPPTTEALLDGRRPDALPRERSERSPPRPATRTPRTTRPSERKQAHEPRSAQPDRDLPSPGFGTSRSNLMRTAMPPQTPRNRDPSGPESGTGPFPAGSRNDLRVSAGSQG
jgi:hypothetical protein